MLLTYTLDAAHILASMPHVFRENVYLTVGGMLGMYLLVIGGNLLLHSRLRANPDIIRALCEEQPLLKTEKRDVRTQ